MFLSIPLNNEEIKNINSIHKEKLKTEQIDYFVFGHRHLPLIFELENNSKYINLGDWISYFTYGVFDGQKFDLEKFED